jgi:hypothetical protein
MRLSGGVAKSIDGPLHSLRSRVVGDFAPDAARFLARIGWMT